MIPSRFWTVVLLLGAALTGWAQDRARVPARTQEIKLRKKVEPVYPAKAKAAKLEGTVKLSVIIGKNGLVQSTQVTSGPIELRRAAADAVEKYVYEPTTVNGEVVEVITDVDVVFVLDASKK